MVSTLQVAIVLILARRVLLAQGLGGPHRDLPGALEAAVHDQQSDIDDEGVLYEVSSQLCEDDEPFRRLRSDPSGAWRCRDGIHTAET